MSSKVIRDPSSVNLSPMLWRQVSDGAPAATGALPDSTIVLAARRREKETKGDPKGDDAYQRGYADGQAAGSSQASGEVEPMLERLAKTMAALAGVRSRLRREAEEDLLKLAIAIARRVLHRELTIDPESIQGLLKVALEKLQSREISRVRIHPRSEGSIRTSLARLGITRELELTPDPTLQWGDVIFETAHGNLDASIDAQLREIERGFADRLQSHT